MDGGLFEYTLTLSTKHWYHLRHIVHGWRRYARTGCLVHRRPWYSVLYSIQVDCVAYTVCVRLFVRGAPVERVQSCTQSIRTALSLSLSLDVDGMASRHRVRPSQNADQYHTYMYSHTHVHTRVHTHGEWQPELAIS